MDCLLLRLDAPLMSFGSVVVDQINPVDRFPGRSLLTGLLGNALGLDHADVGILQSLQRRLRHASRWDLEPELLVDYQTVDLGQEFMQGTGWTTRGRREDRGHGDATTATHQRWRHYWANGCATVALTIGDPGPDCDAVSLDMVEAALRRPARPLFIGRKTCIPAEPILLGRRQAPGLRQALLSEPLATRHLPATPLRVAACWPADEAPGVAMLPLDDLRDWGNNLHRGREAYATGFLEIVQ